MADPRFVQAECQHCRCEPVHTYRPSSAPTVPAARTGECDSAPLSRREQLDAIGDEEAWLWRLVDEADRVFADAPPAPDAARLAAAEHTLAQAKAFEERIQMQVRAAQAALAAPLSWLRPAYRATVARQLRRDGIGAPETTPDWLSVARTAVAARRRGRMDDIVPLELR